MALTSPLAERLLRKLLDHGEKSSVGRRARAASLTSSSLGDYHSGTLPQKNAFDSSMRHAAGEGAVRLTWGDGGEAEGFIKRVDLVDQRALARVLGISLSCDKVAIAQTNLAPWAEQYPVLNEVVERWAQLRNVRTLGPERFQEWLDAIRVIEFAEASNTSDATTLPIREASARLFKGTTKEASKRIERLAAPIDVLLTGSVDAEIRQPAEIWQELGLFREEQPVRMAGNVVIERDRVTASLDTPYIGLPASTIKRLASKPTLVMTIENQTTFHSEARKRCHEEILLIYTAGMPSPTWREMYARVLKSVPADVPVYHWGDVDEGGFRIASVLAREAVKTGHTLKPWLMHPDDIPVDHRHPATDGAVRRIREYANAAGWSDLGEAIAAGRFTAEQESLAQPSVEG